MDGLEPWGQINIALPDWPNTEPTFVTHLAPALTNPPENSPSGRGHLERWFFIRKHPGWRLRYQSATNLPGAREHLHRHLSQLAGHQVIDEFHDAIYEPEVLAFGGPEAMDVAHDLWCHDSQHLLAHLTAASGTPVPRRARQTMILLVSALQRAAGLDWFEQGDVWHRFSQHRDPPKNLAPHAQEQLRTAVNRLMKVDPRTVTDALGEGSSSWLGSFTRAGERLGTLNATGQLHRGLRDVLAHHLIFTANRHGLNGDEQAILASTAISVAFRDT